MLSERHVRKIILLHFQWILIRLTISLSLFLSWFHRFFPCGLAAAPVASAWCSMGRNASFVRARVARGIGDTKRTRIEIETRRRNEIERNGGNEFTLLVSPFAFRWFGANNCSTSQQLLMIEKRASRLWKRVLAIAIGLEGDRSQTYFSSIVLWDLASQAHYQNAIVERVRLWLLFIGEGGGSFQWRGGRERHCHKTATL